MRRHCSLIMILLILVLANFACNSGSDSSKDTSSPKRMVIEGFYYVGLDGNKSSISANGIEYVYDENNQAAKAIYESCIGMKRCRVDAEIANNTIVSVYSADLIQSSTQESSSQDSYNTSTQNSFSDGSGEQKTVFVMNTYRFSASRKNNRSAADGSCQASCLKYKFKNKTGNLNDYTSQGWRIVSMENKIVPVVAEYATDCSCIGIEYILEK